MCSRNDILQWKDSLERFGHFDNFYSSDLKTEKLFSGLVIGFGPTGKPGRMCNSVR